MSAWNSRWRIGHIAALMVCLVVFGGSTAMVCVRRGSWRPERTLPTDGPGSLLAVSPSGILLFRYLLDVGQEARIVSSRPQLVVTVLAGHRDEITSGTFSLEEGQVATASRDGTARIWDATTGKALHVLEREPWWEEVLDVAFSPDGSTLATADADGTIRLWSSVTGKQVRVLKEHKSFVHSVEFSPDGKLVASSGQDYSVRLWDVETGNEISTFRGFEKQAVYDVAFSPDGKRIAAAGEDGTVRIWDVATGREVLVIAAHKGGASAVAFFPDGRRVITGGRHDCRTRVWDVVSGAKLAEMKAEFMCRHSPFLEDGNRIVLVGRTLSVWVRRFPEWWWGHLYRIEVWAAIAFGLASAILAVRSVLSFRLRGAATDTEPRE